MNSNQTYEKIIKKGSAGKERTHKVAATVGYTLFFTVWLIIGIFNIDIFVPLAVAGALCTVALILLSWKYLDVEYEYALWYGSFEIAKIYSKKSRKNLLSADLKELLIVAPASEEYVNKAEHFGIDKRIDATSPSSEEVWLLVTGGKDEPKTLVFFEADERMLGILKAASPSVFIRKK